MKKLKVFISCNGCLRRLLDRSRLGDFFKANECKIVEIPDDADYIVFVTCSFNQSGEDDCWRRIEEYQKYKGELIIVGCLPKISPIKFNQNFKGKYVSTQDLNNIDQLFNDFKIKYREIPDAHQSLDLSSQTSFLSRLWRRIVLAGVTRSYVQFVLKNIQVVFLRILSERLLIFKKSAFLRICDGCMERCAYCSIYKAVGKLRSKSIQTCVEEYKRILQEGYRRITMLADNIGAYGLDINSSLPELLHELSVASNEEVHWKIEELHPRWVIKYKAKLLRLIEQKKIRELTSPIQSGSNRILSIMNRHHTLEEIKESLLLLKRASPDLKLYTHAIIGFPSETEEDFNQTLKAINDIRFDKVIIHPYYDGYATIASKMDHKIDKAIINRRVKEAIRFLRKKRIPVGQFEVLFDESI